MTKFKDVEDIIKIPNLLILSSSKLRLFCVDLTKSDESLRGTSPFFFFNDGRDLKHETDSLASFQKMSCRIVRGPFS